MVKQIKKNEIDIDATDGGDETQENFRFQHLCTSLIAFDMFQEITEFHELFCELYEDIVAVKKNKEFVGIQIKHRDSKYGPFTCTNETIIKTIKHFDKLEKNYPKKFSKFIIMSNAKIISVNKNDLEFLLKYCKEGKITKISKIKLEDLLEKISKSSEIKMNDLKKILKKLENVNVPDRNELVDSIAAKHVQPIKECKTKNLYELRGIVNSLTELIAKKSRVIDDSLNQYFEFCENTSLKKSHEQIIFKRITKDHVREIIEKNQKIIFLKPEQSSSKKIGSYDLIDRKMSLGRINESEIMEMRNLTHSAESYFLEQHYSDEDGELVEELEHLEILLATQAATSETKARLDSSVFGPKKLDLLNEKIEHIAETRPKDVFHNSPEILKGIIGLLITQCRIAFSEKPEGGFT